MPANFWKNIPKPFTVLAPMDDVTDNVFRQVVLSAARPDVFFTEFTNVDGLVHGGNNIPLRKLDYIFEQHPIIAQIWGNNPENFEKAARIVKKLGFDGIDINMGCPVRDVVKKGCGSGLIGNYELVAEIIKSTKKGAGCLPVSVKTRLGINENIAGKWIGFLLEQNLAAITIHGRVAKQMSQLDANWSEIGKICLLRNEIASDTLIVGNGDVKSYKEVMEKHDNYGVDGVMIGRGIFSDPWIFDKNSHNVHTTQEYFELLLKHIDLFEKTWGQTKNFEILKKFFKMYIKDFEGAGSVRMELMQVKNADQAMELIKSKFIRKLSA